jgi:hypothetical protein
VATKEETRAKENAKLSAKENAKLSAKENAKLSAKENAKLDNLKLLFHNKFNMGNL